MSRQSSPIIPMPDVHGELSLFSSFSAAEISSGCCRGYLHPPACGTLCCFPVPPRAGARPRPGSTCSSSGAPGLYSPIANNKLRDKIRRKTGDLWKFPACRLGTHACSLPHPDPEPEPGAAGRAGARCQFLIKLGPRREPRSASPAPDDTGGEAAAGRTWWYMRKAAEGESVLHLCTDSWHKDAPRSILALPRPPWGFRGLRGAGGAGGGRGAAWSAAGRKRSARTQPALRARPYMCAIFSLTGSRPSSPTD